MEDWIENQQTSSAKLKAGEMIRQARTAAGVKAEDLCASLRISTAALDALEASQYGRLPGDPYVRALMMSIARSLNMDSRKLLAAYAADIGALPPEIPAEAYKDVSDAQVVTHRKLFIGLLAVLLIALLFILAKVNSSPEKKNEMAAPAPPRTDTLAAPQPADTMPESAALRPDSAVAVDSMAKAALADSATAQRQKIVADSIAAHAVKSKTTPNRIGITALTDSAGFRAFRTGHKTVAETLIQGQQTEVRYGDSVTFYLYKSRSLRLSIGDSTVVPVKRRFKVIGNVLSYF
ncbi:MAG TPA: hypothetical protein DCQ83_03380 [Fibrobacteres bacterium]|jgi:cytoskeletal protein RodZ|nr:hypothetical protein [Fibrobacterota bacterium]